MPTMSTTPAAGWAKALLAGAALLSLTACTASPPPPIESTGTVTPTPQPVVVENEIIVAIDDIGSGFNPHLLSHLSPVSSAIADLVLPSPFRPVPDPQSPGGVRWQPDPSVLISGEVTDDGSGEAPFTVTYVLRDEAQWSDSAPIAAEDFLYLWRQMTTQPGVVDPAGYDLITDVRSSSGGKTVTVQFSDPYPAWRELFSHLLPAHLIKDSPGGFDDGLADTIPVSGSRFNIKRVDRGRDDIRLERNDRFWGIPARADRIHMRRGGSATQIADSLRSNDAQIAEVHGGASLQAQLSAIRGLSTARAYQTRALQLVLNTRIEPLDDPELRKALLSFLDTDVLATVGGGGTATVAVAEAQIRPPSDPQYTPTEPARMRYEEAMAVLATSGYQLVDDTLRLGGEPTGAALNLVIGVPGGDQTARAVANTAADQLRHVGVRARVSQLAPARLYGEALTGGEIDMLVGWTQTGFDPATALASRWACPPGEAAPPAGPEPAENERDAERAPSNLSGACAPAIDDRIRAALTGQADADAVIAQAEPVLWELAAVRPILQDVTLVAARDTVAGVNLDLPVPVGVFGDAAQWTRLPE